MHCTCIFRVQTGSDNAAQPPKPTPDACHSVWNALIAIATGPLSLHKGYIGGLRRPHYAAGKVQGPGPW